MQFHTVPPYTWSRSIDSTDQQISVSSSTIRYDSGVWRIDSKADCDQLKSSTRKPVGMASKRVGHRDRWLSMHSEVMKSLPNEATIGPCSPCCCRPLRDRSIYNGVFHGGAYVLLYSGGGLISRCAAPSWFVSMMRRLTFVLESGVVSPA